MENERLRQWEAKHPGLVTNLLLHLISESQALGGSFRLITTSTAPRMKHRLADQSILHAQMSLSNTQKSIHVTIQDRVVQTLAMYYPKSPTVQDFRRSLGGEIPS